MSNSNACQSPEVPHFEVSMQRADTVVEVRGAPNTDGGLHELRMLYTVQGDKEASRLVEILNSYRRMRKFISGMTKNPGRLNIMETYECHGLLQQSPEI
jgi:hypothetical protein